MYGLKRVSQRRDDALSRVGWEQLETMLATYYRGRGYQVDHVGTGASGMRFDGGIDLKLRRESEYILVQCKHWNAMKVTHNAVHELLGIMVNEGATGAILVTSGEFSKAAIEAGTRQGHVQLIDGEELRAMIGPVPEPAERSAAPHASASDYVASARTVAGTVGERLLAATEDRIRHGRRGASTKRNILLWALPLKLVFALIMFLVFSYMIKNALAPLLHRSQISGQPQAQMLPAPISPTNGYVAQSARADGIVPSEVVAPVPHHPTKAEIRESQRKADEAIKVLAPNTPDM